MRIQDIKIGEYYRLTGTNEYYGYYGWVKVLKIYKKGQWDNPFKVSCVMCKQVVSRDCKVGLFKYFRPSELIKEEQFVCPPCSPLPEPYNNLKE
jgi:hypothetical protein